MLALSKRPVSSVSTLNLGPFIDQGGLGGWPTALHFSRALLSPLSDSNPSVVRDLDLLLKRWEVQAMSSVTASFCCLEFTSKF